MMTPEEIKLIRTILEDEVTTCEWNLDNDTTVGKTWSLEHLNNAQMALEAFNKNVHLLKPASCHDVDEFYKDEE